MATWGHVTSLGHESIRPGDNPPGERNRRENHPDIPERRKNHDQHDKGKKNHKKK